MSLKEFIEEINKAKTTLDTSIERAPNELRVLEERIKEMNQVVASAKPGYVLKDLQILRLSNHTYGVCVTLEQEYCPKEGLSREEIDKRFDDPACSIDEKRRLYEILERMNNPCTLYFEKLLEKQISQIKNEYGIELCFLSGPPIIM